MGDWTGGYVADIGYTYGYYAELNPLRMKLAFLNQGLSVPKIENACELGFGQGLSVNIHAAASHSHWFGTDFNPSQAGFARELAQAAGTSASLHDDAFLDFCRRDDLPEFDFIGLHGIWSWISDENRAVIVEFLQRKLRVGGVLYISYNTLPGWTNFAPMRHLLAEHARAMGASGGSVVSRIDGALGFADAFMETNPAFARANPQTKDRLTKVKEQNRNYVAHEYFNQDFHPMYFADMAKWLEPAKVQFACSAHYIDHIDSLNLTAEQLKLLNDIPAPLFRESTRDFMVNQQFRRDYWVKGLRRMPAFEQITQLREQRVILVAPRDQVSLKVNGALGEGNMNEGIYNPILDLLADHKPRTIGQIEKAVADKKIVLAQVVQAMMLLGGNSVVLSALDETSVSKLKKTTDRLNTHLCQRALSNSDISYLASPVVGAGMIISRFQQLFLLALGKGHRQVGELVEFAYNVLASQNQNIVKDGKTLQTPEENRAELREHAENFINSRLPILKALQIA